jgi:RNA polymerase sigma-70 factor (sigma-E family)
VIDQRRGPSTSDILSERTPPSSYAGNGADLPCDRDAAVTALFLAHHRRLVGLARLLVDDQQSAEDVVQDAFGQLHRRWSWLRDKDAAVAYLQTAVVNGSRSTLRRRRVRRREDSVVLPADAPSAELSAVVEEDHRELRAAIAGLSQRQRQVLVLRYYLDLSEAEIAQSLDISRGSVKQHAARGMAALSARLEAQR